MEILHSISGSISGTRSVSGEINPQHSLSGIASTAIGAGGMTTDKTLTIPGRAADAAVVGKLFDAVDRRMADLETDVGDASLLLSLI